jgi:hypothetical protein
MHFSFSSNSLEEIRDFYYKVGLEKAEIEDFECLLNKKTNIPLPELEGYRAVICFLKAKRLYNPYKKYEAFSEGKKKLEFIIKKYPNNIELHFLRLMIQDNLPSFLGYSDQIEKDKIFIKKSIKKLKRDSDLKTRIIEYLIKMEKHK